MRFLKNKFVVAALPLIAVAAIYVGVLGLNTYWNLIQAEKILQEGRGAMASDILEPYRDRVTRNERGCSAYLKAGFLAHKMDRIQWGSESCSAHGIDLPEVSIALASTKEVAGENQEAINILIEAAPRFKDSPMIYLKLFSMMKTAKNEQGMRFAMLKAVDQAPADAKVLWNALQFFAAGSKWEEAKQMALKIKDLPEANLPEIKFLAARSLANGGDRATSVIVAEQGKTLIATKPELQERLKKEFPEFFAAVDQQASPPAPSVAQAQPNMEQARPIPGNQRGLLRAPTQAAAEHPTGKLQDVHVGAPNGGIPVPANN